MNDTAVVSSSKRTEEPVELESLDRVAKLVAVLLAARAIALKEFRSTSKYGVVPIAPLKTCTGR